MVRSHANFANGEGAPALVCHVLLDFATAAGDEILFAVFETVEDRSEVDVHDDLLRRSGKSQSETEIWNITLAKIRHAKTGHEFDQIAQYTAVIIAEKQDSRQSATRRKKKAMAVIMCLSRAHVYYISHLSQSPSGNLPRRTSISHSKMRLNM